VISDDVDATVPPARPRWAPKLLVALIARLYRTDAAGIRDDELLNDVGWRLHGRCRSLTLVTSRRMACPECRTEFAAPPLRSPADTYADCPTCRWSITAADYRASWRHRDLMCPGLPVVAEFVDRWPRLTGYVDRLLLVDRLVHAVHATGGYSGAQPLRREGPARGGDARRDRPR